MTDPERGLGGWTEGTRDRVFFAALGASLLAVLWIVSPFLDALLFAGATVVVTWPIYERVLRATRGRRTLAAGLTGGGILLLFLVPLTLLGVWLVQESATFVQQVVELANSGELRVELERATAARLPFQDRVEAFVGRELDLVDLVAGPLQRVVVTAGQALATTLPNLIGGVASAALDAFVYLFAVITLYTHGPVVLDAASRLTPMREEYARRLFEVFREFSTNLVFGSFATAALQAVVACVGFAIAGVPDLLLVTLLTGVFAFVPFVGSALVWVPAATWMATHGSVGWGAFVVVWSLGLTGMVDNLVRPFLLRGRSPIHPLPIVLSVLGGILWLGLPGALVGPVAVAMFLALYTIWTEDFERQPPPAGAAGISPGAVPTPTSQEPAPASGSPASGSSSAAPSTSTSGPPAVP